MSSSIRDQIRELSCLNSAVAPLSDDEAGFEHFAVSRNTEFDRRSEENDSGSFDGPRGLLPLKTDLEICDVENTYQGVKVSRAERESYSPEIEGPVNYHEEESDSNDEEESSHFSDSMASYTNDSVGVDHENEVYESSSIGEKNEILHDAQSSELARGISTSNQLGFSDRLFELRIKLQKPLQSSNRYPQCEKINIFQNLSSLFTQEQREVRMIIMSLLEKLLALHKLLSRTQMCSFVQPSSDDGNISTNCKETEKTAHDKRLDTNVEVKSHSVVQSNSVSRPEGVQQSSRLLHTGGDIDMEIDKLHGHLRESVSPIIDKWDERLRVASGKGMKRHFSSFNRSALSQVKQVLIDKKRLIRRTKLKRSVYRTLGVKTNDDSHYTERNDNADLHLQTLDEEIFDDDDFYHQLLKEFIGRSLSVNNESSVKRLNLEALHSQAKEVKMKNATKGRKIRYNLHSKLLNFMVPISFGNESHQSRTDLFKSLFGGK